MVGARRRARRPRRMLFQERRIMRRPIRRQRRAWDLFGRLGGPARAGVDRSTAIQPVPDTLARIPAEPAASPVLSLNVKETIEHAGQAKVIVKFAEPSQAGATLSVAASSTQRQLEDELAAIFIAPSDVEVEALAAASDDSSGAMTGHRGGPGRAPKVYFYPRLGLAVGTVQAAGADSLARHPLVREVVKAPELSLIRPIGGRPARASAATSAWGIERLRVPELWARNIKGEGILVGHLDTGIDGKHPALKSAIHEFAQFDMLARRVPDATASDSGAHGTHTAGTIAGRPVKGVVIGVAPAAKLLSGMVIEGGQVVERILAGMEWIVENKGRVLSLSLGIRGFTTAFEVVIQSLRDAGVLPVVACGNENANSSRSPGNYATVLSVGACDELDRVPTFSGSQRFARPDDAFVPDLVAPGVEVLSCKVGGGYRFDSGTSMATPHIAGLAALLLSAKPDATITEVERAILDSCARPATMQQDRANRGLPNAVVALERLLGHPLAAVRTQPTKAPGKAARGTRRPKGNGSAVHVTGKARRAGARRASQTPREST